MEVKFSWGRWVQNSESEAEGWNCNNSQEWKAHWGVKKLQLIFSFVYHPFFSLHFHVTMVHLTFFLSLIGRTHKRHTNVDTLHMDEQRQDDQLKPTYNSSVQIQGVDLKTCRKQWTIGKGGGKESGISVLMAWHDDDDVFCYPPQLWVKLYHCCSSTRIALALNNPWKLICH